MPQKRPTPSKPAQQWWTRVTRDLVLFGAGLGFFAHEVLAAQVERPYIITACLGMMGLPVFLRLDERRSRPEKETK